jgi:hypothetical protein
MAPHEELRMHTDHSMARTNYLATIEKRWRERPSRENKRRNTWWAPRYPSIQFY